VAQASWKCCYRLLLLIRAWPITVAIATEYTLGGYIIPITTMSKLLRGTRIQKDAVCDVYCLPSADAACEQDTHSPAAITAETQSWAQL
jgi:hypothetical protein